MTKNYIHEHRSGANGYILFLYIYFVIDFFLHLSQRIPGYGVVRPTLLLVILITALLFLNKEKLPKIGSEPSIKAILYLMVYIIVTLPLVKWPGSVLFHNIPEYIKAVVYFFFTALIINSEKRLYIFLFVFCASQVFRVMEPLYLYLSEGYLGGETYLGGGEFAGRLGGAAADVVNANGLGFVIVTVIPFLHYLLWKSGTKLYKMIYLGIMPLLIYALILTMSRGSFLALLVVLWMIFKESKRKVLMVMFLVCSVFIIWPNLSDIQKDRYMSLVSSHAIQSNTAEGRYTGMASELKIGFRRPIFGHGLGTSMEARFNETGVAQISHNTYEEVFMELGIVGLIIFIYFIKSIYDKYRENIKSLHSRYGDDGGSFPVRLNAAFGAIFWMYILFSFNYFGLSQYHWYLFAGLMVAFSRIYCSERERSDNGP